MDQQESGESEGTNEKQCKLCKKAFARRSHLLRHMLCHNDQRPYQCQQCELAFKQKPHLDRHVERFHMSSSSSSAEKWFKCLVCLKLFRTAYERHRHCKVMHSGAGVSTDQPNYRCKICGRTNFSTRQQFDNHIQWHSEGDSCWKSITNRSMVACVGNVWSVDSCSVNGYKWNGIAEECTKSNEFQVLPSSWSPASESASTVSRSSTALS
ncbi:zinc finger protein [Trichinella spiralis]|uniref:zinc finger protein n=1 Tax=Trichinella spiralis TaxID=6334 RepID=UPI0001EFBF35|nr:zinc finger protein [Trichinella spiralis]